MVSVPLGYKNPVMGYNIGFRFTDNSLDYKADRAEVDEFYHKNGGVCFQGGGLPGSEYFVIFGTVKTRDDADKFLPIFLPKLETFVRDLR